MGAEEQVEFAQGLDGIGEERLDGTGRLAAQGSGVVRRSALGAERSAGTIVEKSCGALYQKIAPISAKPKGLRCEQKFRAPGWEWADRPQPEAGALQVLG